ncbi:MAG: DUF2059 domain-containing protein [Erythrobacter sp.]|uniref:DUF2059 domain-containing protein n=1 Tax=Erythrobacter sp. TaxID=1042 RepID=UPI002631E2C9|nr:DUF2059 domain-containing protein [Erythrobacter sp.]MDJ0979802.1 DUF2059 domain-containing protein [Erythrobacter sp.]
MGFIRHAFFVAILGALSPAVFPVIPAAAQPAQAPQADAASEHADLYTAMQEGIDQNAIIDSTLIAMDREFRTIPVMQDIEASSPGTIGVLVEELRPVMERVSARVTAKYRPDMIALFEAKLTAEEARDVAAFYRSDLGRKLLNTASINFSPDATMSSVGEGGEVTEEQVTQDLSKAAEAAAKSMTADDMATMAREVAKSPALLKMNAINPEVRKIRVQMEREQPNAEEQAEIGTVVTRVLAERMGG